LIKVACVKGKSCNIKFLQPAHRTTQILSISEAVESCKRNWKTCPTHNVWRQV